MKSLKNNFFIIFLFVNFYQFLFPIYENILIGSNSYIVLYYKKKK